MNTMTQSVNTITPQNITFTTEDGSSLNALLGMVPGSQPGNLVIFCHGHTETMNSFDDYFNQFTSADVMTLAISYRNDQGFPVLGGAQDVIFAAGYILKNYPSVQTLYIYSASMGGAIAGTAIAESIKYQDPLSRQDPLNQLRDKKFQYWVDVSGVTNLVELYPESALFDPSAKTQIENDVFNGGTGTPSFDQLKQRSPALRGSDLKAAGLRQVEMVHAVFDGVVLYNQAVELKGVLISQGIGVSLDTLTTYSGNGSSGAVLTDYIKLSAALAALGIHLAGHVNTADVNNPASSAGIGKLHSLLNSTMSRSANSTWMQSNLGTLGAKNLRNICLPGTHDSGMSQFNPGTLFAAPCNVVTQTTGILGQLRYGARYFDIRPVISGGQYVTGHYTELTAAGINSWQGANGQSIASLIDDLNTFTEANQELIVLYLSHDLDTDVGNDAYAPFTQTQWDALLLTLQDINHLFVYAGSPTTDLTTLPLNTYIGAGKAAVVVVVDASGSGITLGNQAGQGFYLPNNFPVYNEYSDTNNLQTMVSDQLAKMAAQKTTSDASYFLLSWTLTQSTEQAATCGIGLSQGIVDLANSANAQLSSQLLPACNANCFPNIIYIDNISAAVDVLAIARQVNSLV